MNWKAKKKVTSQWKKWIYLLLGVVLTSVIVLFVIMAVSPYKNMWFGRRGCSVWNQGWLYETTDGQSERITLPAEIDMDGRQEIRINNVIPTVYGADQTLCIRSSQQDVEVWIDGKMIETYSDEHYRVIGQASASVWLFVDLKEEYCGKTIELIFRSVLPEYAGILNEVYIGDSLGIMFYLLGEYGLLLYTGLIVLISGLIFLVLHVALRKNVWRSRQMFFLALFLICFAGWILCESKIRQIYAGNMNLLNTMSFFFTMVFPIPMCLYINEIEERRYEEIFYGLTVVYAINYFINLGLVLFTSTQLVDTTKRTVVLIGAGLVCILVTLFLSVKKEKQRFLSTVCVGITLLLVFCAIDLLKYLFVISMGFGTYSCIGVLIFLTLIFVNTMIQLMNVVKQRFQVTMENREKTLFLRNVSREIEQPLQTIQHMTRRLQQRKLPAEELAFIDTIQAASLQMMGILSEIEDYSVTEPGNLTVDKGAYRFERFFTDMMCALIFADPKKIIRITSQIDNQIPQGLIGDEIHLRQFYLEFIEKAMATMQEGVLRVRVWFEELDAEEGKLVVELVLPGADAWTSDANINLLLDALEGELECFPEYGKWESTVVRVGILQGIYDGRPSNYGKHVNLDAAWDRSANEIQLQNTRILLVGENRIELVIEKSVLEGYGAEIVVAENANQAVSFMEEHRDIDMIFVEVNTDGMDGIECVNRIRRIPEDYYKYLPIIAVRSVQDKIAGEIYLQASMNAWIVKPFRADQLETLLQLYIKQEKKRSVSLLDRISWETEESRQSGSRYVELLSRLRGVDVSSGISCCDNKMTVYLSALRIFDNTDWSSKLDYLIKKEDLQQYGIYVSHLKLCAINIGAGDFAEWSRVVEIAVQRQELSYVKELHQEYITQYRRIHEMIHEALKVFDEPMIME